jgi:DtxR family Mn-dependent transcriptional regulator
MTRQSVCSKESNLVPRDLSTTLEHYIETIYELQTEWGAASVTDIAEKRGVKSPSVTYVLQKLKSLGLVRYKKYRSVSLTAAGMSRNYG